MTGLPMRRLEQRPCGAEGCDRAAKQRGHCGLHAYRLKVHGTSELPPAKVCSFPDCGWPVTRNRLCNAHSAQHRRGVDLHPVERRTAPPVPKRYSRKYEPAPCWFPACDRTGGRGGLCDRHYRFERKIKHDYALSIEDYLDLLDRAGHRCAICRDTEQLAIDHDHRSGQVRAVLCLRCNTAVGMVREDPAVARSLLAYVEGIAACRP